MSDKKARSGSVKKPSRWLHPSQSLIKGSIVYAVKFWGGCDVPAATGTEVVRTAIEKLRLQRQVQKQQGAKSLKVKFSVSYRGIRVQDAKSKAVLHQHNLSAISYAGDDKTDKSLFAYIAAEDKNKPPKHFRCYIYETEKFASQMSLTVAQSFHLAFKNLEDKAGTNKPVHKKFTSMQRESIDVASDAGAQNIPVAHPVSTQLATAAIPEEQTASAPAASAPAANASAASAPAANASAASAPAASLGQAAESQVDTSGLGGSAWPEMSSEVTGGGTTEEGGTYHFEPFDAAEAGLPAPVFGPGIEDIDGAIKSIEAQMASLEEGFEFGFTLDASQ